MTILRITKRRHTWRRSDAPFARRRFAHVKVSLVGRKEARETLRPVM
jgi:hypothetical protein